MRDPEQTKSRLIEVASKMMADHGVAGLRVDRVASLAKINKRMIYYYFGDKEGLAAKVLEQQLLAITTTIGWF
jgi:AcrR family transcriptional regulator